MSEMLPKVRFQGFTGDWEDRKLEEVLRERNNQQSQSLEYPLVSFTVEKGVTPKTDRYEREQLVVGDKSSKKYKVTVLNDIVYNPANLKFGAISRNKYGNAVFSPIYITFVVNNDVTTPEFIEMFVTRNDFIKRALKYQQGTVYERQSVSPADLLSMVLYLPGKAEQEKIGSFFKQLDDTIALHQRKLDLLKEQKKGFLQKMFPKDGQLVPEVRFAGFTDDWEQRKLGELASNFEYGLNASAKEFDGIHKYIRITDIDDSSRKFNSDSITSPDIDLSSADNYKLKNGDLLFARTGASVGKSYLYTESDGLVYYAGFLIRARLKSEFDSNFVFQNTLTNDYNNFIKVTSQRSGQPGVNAQEYASFNIKTPCYDEQQKIGLFFKQLDDLITLHQRKVDFLKEQKKGYLQKMFVS